MFSVKAKIKKNSNFSPIAQQGNEKGATFNSSTSVKKLHIQAKLSIGQPDDTYEQEADRVANQVVKMHETSILKRQCSECKGESVQTKPLYTQVTPFIQCQPLEEEEELLQPKQYIKGKPVADETQSKNLPPYNLDTQISREEGKGFPLPHETKTFMESRFGTDFSKVKVHTDSNSIQINKKLQAKAFTHKNDIYFNTGQYNPVSSGGKYLIAHELAHVMQQKGINKKGQIQRKLVYGSGYKGYPDDKKEVKKAEKGEWNPTTIDFKANAGRSGGGDGAKDLSALLDIIEKQSSGSITKLGIIGHSNSSALGLSGDVHSPGVPMTGLITESTLKANKAKIDSLKDRFAKDAEIILYSCNSGGVGGGLLKAISKALGICVKGFSKAVNWCIIWKTPSLKINTRGNVFYADPNDPLAGLLLPDCKDFHGSVNDLTPDSTSCEGVKKVPDKKCVNPDDVISKPGFQLINFVPSSGMSGFHNESEQLTSGQIEGLKRGDGLDWGTWHLRPRVKKLQALLGVHGFFTEVDGMFGPKTLAALNAFQGIHELTPGEVVDRVTAERLEGKTGSHCPTGEIPVPVI